jgi:hypothetical protein
VAARRLTHRFARDRCFGGVAWDASLRSTGSLRVTSVSRGCPGDIEALRELTSVCPWRRDIWNVRVFRVCPNRARPLVPCFGGMRKVWRNRARARDTASAAPRALVHREGSRARSLRRSLPGPDALVTSLAASTSVGRRSFDAAFLMPPRWLLRTSGESGYPWISQPLRSSRRSRPTSAISVAMREAGASWSRRSAPSSLVWNVYATCQALSEPQAAPA